MNKLIKKIAKDNNCSPYQAAIIINHTKYLIKRYLENYNIEDACQVCIEVLGMTEEQASRLENQKVEV